MKRYMVRLTDHLNMTIAVDWEVKPHIKHITCVIIMLNSVFELAHKELVLIAIHLAAYRSR